MDDQYFSSKKFVFLKQNYFDSNSHQYIIKKELNGETLINSIKKYAERGYPNLMIISDAVWKAISQELVSIARYIEPIWSIVYIKNSRLFYYDDGRSVLHKKINVGILFSHLEELFINRLFFPHRVIIRADRLVIFMCRDRVIECAVRLYEQGLDDSLIEKLCDSTGKRRVDVRNWLKLMRVAYSGSRRNIGRSNDEFLVGKVMEAGLMGEDIFVPSPNTKFYIYKDIPYFIKRMVEKYEGPSD